MGDYKFTIKANEYLPLRDVVFNTLRDAILTGKLVPGERLMENQLAEKLGVSRTPIREALRMLEIENLVELVPRKGAQVLDMSEKDIIDVLELRGALESLAVSIACRKMNNTQIQKLREAQKNFEMNYVNEDFEKTAEADEAFHALIFSSTENDKLIHIINTLRTQLYRYRITHLKVPERSTLINEQHNKIIEAIEKHDENEGIKAAKNHVKSHTEFILNTIRSTQEYKE